MTSMKPDELDSLEAGDKKASYGTVDESETGEKKPSLAKKKWASLRAKQAISRCSAKDAKSRMEDLFGEGADKDQHECPNVRKQKVIDESAAGLPVYAQVLVYLAAVGLLVVVLVAPMYQAQYNEEHNIKEDHSHNLMRNVAYAVVGAGSMAYLMYMLGQPLLLGYLLGGVLIGPIGLRIIIDQHEIHSISELGLIFLLFMIGLELNLKEIAALGKQVFSTGTFQFPICAATHYGILMLLVKAGLNFGTEKFAILYVAVCCSLSSTMIVVKLLQEKSETGTQAGRITIGILIFQDLWAIVSLAIQSNLENPDVLPLMKTFAVMGLLVAMAFAYSKYVLPPVFQSASKATEMMLVISLTWCFFVCCVAILKWVSLSMELAALVAGVSMATFPYSTELNGRIKYIRDFFITLYFVALGMQIPVPKLAIIGAALAVVLMVVLARWLGVFIVLWTMGSGSRTAAITTINLSQISEFALVICALGKTNNHIGEDTMTILIWAFSILAVAASYMIGFNDKIFGAMESVVDEDTRAALDNPNDLAEAVIVDGGDMKASTKRRASARLDAADLSAMQRQTSKASAAESEHEEGHGSHEIMMLGCWNIGWAFIEEISKRRPELLKKICVIDFNTHNKKKCQDYGVGFHYADISNEGALQHIGGAEVKIAISSISDIFLKGVSNEKLIELSKDVWPNAQVISIADTPEQTAVHYRAGADYVLMLTQCSAERIAEILEMAPDNLDLYQPLRRLPGSDNPLVQQKLLKESASS